MREPDETEVAEMLAEADLAGVADVLAVRDRHALIKFVKLTKGRPPRETPPPFDASGGAGFLTAVVALREHDVDETNHRPGLRIRTHLVHRRPFEPLFRTLAPWNSVTVLGEVPGPGPGIVPGRRRSG